MARAEKIMENIEREFDKLVQNMRDQIQSKLESGQLTYMEAEGIKAMLEERLGVPFDYVDPNETKKELNKFLEERDNAGWSRSSSCSDYDGWNDSGCSQG